MKHCPYEEIGCKFLHLKSKRCIYQEKCRTKLCPFQHGQVNIPENTMENYMEINIDAKEKGNIQVDDHDLHKEFFGQYFYDQKSENKNIIQNFDCELCDVRFHRKGKLIKHIKSMHPDEDRVVYFMCEDCGHRGGDFDKHEFQNHKNQDEFEFCIEMKKHIRDEHNVESSYGKGLS